MQKIWRRTVKWSVRILVLILIITALQITVLAYPQPFFSHKMETEYGAVYSDSEFTQELIDAINDVTFRLDAVELYGPGKDNCVFIFHSQRLYSFFARLSMVTPMAQGYNLAIFGNSYISMLRINQLRSASGGFPPYAINEGNPAHTIAHELVHQYIADEIGYWAIKNTPPLKLEGLAEYGASIAHIRNNTVHTLPRRIDLLLDDQYWRHGIDRVREHYRAGLIIEYLSEIEGYTLADLISDTVTLETGNSRMLQWYNSETSRDK